MRGSFWLLLSGMMMFLAGCGCSIGGNPTEVQPIQKGDKQLSCKDIILEMNEAEFHRKSAEERKKGKIEDVILPYCFPSGYLTANKAEKAALARLDYLNQIYDLMDCETKSKFESRKLPPPPTVYQDTPPPPPVK